MGLEWLPLILGVCLAQLAPGPNLMAVASVALGSGRVPGVMVAAGVATGVAIWSLAFSFGVAALFARWPALTIAMQVLGGGYLLFLGLRALRSVRRADAAVLRARAQQMGLWRAWRLGLGVVLSNPKAVIMWVAISSFVASAKLSQGHFLLMGLGFSASALLIYGGYAWLFSTHRAMRGYQRFTRWVDAAFGAMFGVLGGTLLLNALREMRA